MKQISLTYLLLFCIVVVYAEQGFKFALFTDLHIQISNPLPEEDLRKAVDDVNQSTDIDFVLINGDITETGDLASLQKAKEIISGLKVPWYITSGNHDTKWTPSGGTAFGKVFGDDKFSFEHKGYRFIGFNTGPLIKMGDGHIYPQDFDWVEKELQRTNDNSTVFIVTHYPLLQGDVDNWYLMTHLLRKYDVKAVLSGHYHRNALLNYDQIPGIVLRSTLRANAPSGGYSVFTVNDSLHIAEKIIGKPPIQWLSLSLEKRSYDHSSVVKAPGFEVNQKYKKVKPIWLKDTRMAIFGSPAIFKKAIYFGDDAGFLHCMNVDNGSNLWSYKTGSRIVSTPVIHQGKIVFGSTDGNIYCLDASSGNLIWKYLTLDVVMGNPIVVADTVFIGGSDGCFRALNLNTGKVFWEYCEVNGYIETKPVYTEGIVIFGAWDTFLYALDAKSGKLHWKWNNGSKQIHFSSAAVWPVAAHGKVFITAPDRFLTAIDIKTGKTVWRTNKHTVRETIGIATDGNTIYSRCMTDSVLAVDTRENNYTLRWKSSAHFGYDHNPSMLIEMNGVIIFGTKNGLICGVGSRDGKLLWQHKIGNTSVQTITPLKQREFLITTLDGKVGRIKF